MQTSPNIQHENTGIERKSGHGALIALIIGLVMLAGSTLTYILPMLLYPGGNAAGYENEFIAGLWEIFLGIPLFVIGLVCLIIAAVVKVKETK